MKTLREYIDLVSEAQKLNWKTAVKQMIKLHGLPEKIEGYCRYTLEFKYAFTPSGSEDAITFGIDNYGVGSVYAALADDDYLSGWPIIVDNGSESFPSYKNASGVIQSILDIIPNDAPYNFVKIAENRGKAWDLSEWNKPEIDAAVEQEMERTGHDSLYDFCIDDSICEMVSDNAVDASWKTDEIEITWNDSAKLELVVKGYEATLKSIPDELVKATTPAPATTKAPAKPVAPNLAQQPPEDDQIA